MADFLYEVRQQEGLLICKGSLVYFTFLAEKPTSYPFQRKKTKDVKRTQILPFFFLTFYQNFSEKYTNSSGPASLYFGKTFRDSKFRDISSVLSKFQFRLLQLEKFVFTEHTQISWGIDLFLENNQRPVTINQSQHFDLFY